MSVEPVRWPVTIVTQQSNAGLVVLPDIFTAAQAIRDLIVARTAQHRIPAIYPIALFARAGGLVSYGIDSSDLQRRAAAYVDRALKGAKPRDLPVQQPTRSLTCATSTKERTKLSAPIGKFARNRVRSLLRGNPPDVTRCSNHA
jgi:putative tryptophan/tyrosine transport system substrate-binding protein